MVVTNDTFCLAGGSYVSMQFQADQQVGAAGWSYDPGEEGRQALIASKAKLTDRPFVDAMKFIAQRGPYLPPAARGVKYSDTQLMRELTD